MTNYYDLPQVSNSDLSWIKQQIKPVDMPDPTLAYRFGNLLDAVITDNSRVDYNKQTVDGEKFSKVDFKKAEKMKNSFLRDDYCRDLINGAEFQTVIINTLELEFKGIPFSLECRCKWDILKQKYNFGGDIKSTMAKTQAQFESSIFHFDYDRQRAFYMDVTETDVDVIIGISKVNNKIFKVFIDRNSDIYLEGKDKYTYLAYKYNLLFGNGENNLE